jgi:hypothetical protein
MTSHNYYEREKGIELLRKRGAVKAIVEFSGGNDEGGVDGIQIVFPGDKPAENLEVYYDGAQMEYVEGQWRQKPKEKATEDQELSLILQKPVDDEFGSWAGEFEAYGTLTWDVETGTCKMDKYVQSGYDHYSSDF